VRRDGSGSVSSHKTLSNWRPRFGPIAARSLPGVEILHREAAHDGVRHHDLLEATVSGILAAELQSDHPATDDWDLFNVVATHLSDDHLPHVIQERRETRQCLACGESSSLWRFQDGPKVKAQSELMQVLREWTRRDRATRGRAAEGRAHSTGRIDTGSWDAAHGPCR
jgi:hypothetical protein